MHVILYYIRVPIYYEHVFDFCILLGRIIVAASHRILLDILYFRNLHAACSECPREDVSGPADTVAILTYCCMT